MKRDGRGTTHSDSSGLVGSGITDSAIRKGTGKGWGEWYGLLDAAGAREMTHQQIVSVVAAQQAGEWWQQMITVAYEQARGIRTKHHKDDGFSANASKTIKAGVTRLFDAWVDDEQRAAWLDATGWHIRKSTPYKNLRFTWVDGRTHVEVHLWPRGEGRTLIQIEHSKLSTLDDVQRLKAFWGVALERLRKLTEAIDRPEALAV
jgi:uncharacterized protein YndB with AHSA1/START domain